MNNASYSNVPELRKAKKRAKWPFVLLALIVMAAAGYVVYAKAITGWLTTDVTVEVETSDDGSASIYGTLNGFAALKDVSYTVDEDVLTLEVRCTWPLFSRDKEFAIICESGAFAEVLEVDVSDGSNSLVVWLDE